MATRTRARNDREKEARAGLMVASARELFARDRFATVKVEDISRRAGISKGTVFLYFGTKEGLGLAVLGVLLEEWGRDLESRLTRLGPRGSPETIATAVRKSLEGRQELLGMLPLLGDVLEANAPADAGLRFRASLRDMADRVGGLLEDSAGFLNAGEGTEIMMTILAIAMGIQQMGGGSVDVASAVGRTLRLYLEGVKVVAERSPPPPSAATSARPRPG